MSLFLPVMVFLLTFGLFFMRGIVPLLYRTLSKCVIDSSSSLDHANRATAMSHSQEVCHFDNSHLVSMVRTHFWWFMLATRSVSIPTLVYFFNGMHSFSMAHSFLMVHTWLRLCFCSDACSRSPALICTGVCSNSSAGTRGSRVNPPWVQVLAQTAHTASYTSTWDPGQQCCNRRQRLIQNHCDWHQMYVVIILGLRS